MIHNGRKFDHICQRTPDLTPGLPSRYTFTAQYSYMDDPTTSASEGFGLMFYNARWYDPGLGRFAQADTIIPLQTQGVQAWDRFAYANNNPLRYTDPSGHCVVGGHDVPDSSPACKKYADPVGNKAYTTKKQEMLDYNGWDLVPLVNNFRKIIRGSQIADQASNHPEFNSQQTAVQSWHDNCYGQCHYSAYVEHRPGMPVGGPQPDTPVFDQYSEGMGDIASGVVELGIQAATTTAIIKNATSGLEPVQVFAHGGPQWHVGLETVTNMNIIHIGNHSQYGIHIAFGAVRPYAANLHIYLQKTLPFFRIWKP